MTSVGGSYVCLMKVGAKQRVGKCSPPVCCRDRTPHLTINCDVHLLGVAIHYISLDTGDRHSLTFSKLIYNEKAVCQLLGSVFSLRLFKTLCITIAKNKLEMFVMMLPKVGNKLGMQSEFGSKKDIFLVHCEYEKGRKYFLGNKDFCLKCTFMLNISPYSSYHVGLWVTLVTVREK